MRRGIAEVLEDEAAQSGLLSVLRAVPAYRRYWEAELDADGQPKNPQALQQVADGNALVRVRNLSRKKQR